MIISVYPPLDPRLFLARKIATKNFPFSDEKCRLTHLGRGAIWLGLQALTSLRSVAMPAFHCGSEVEVARVLGLEIEFYRVTPDLVVDVDHMVRTAARCDAVYLISNFGFPTCYAEAKETGKLVIEDVAHGLYSRDASGRFLGSGADLAIFCPRKSLGVPDGGAFISSRLIDRDDQPSVKTRHSVRRALVSLTLGRAAQSRTKSVASVASQILRRASVTERAARDGTLTEAVIGEWSLEDADLRAAAGQPSRFTEFVIARTQGDETRRLRRLNYVTVASELIDYVPQHYRVLPDGVCPLYVPLVVSDRVTVLRSLWAAGIRAIEIWPVAHPLLAGYDDLGALRSRLIAFPVHQGLDVELAEEISRLAHGILSRESG